MVPNDLSKWNREVIDDLVVKGWYESEHFDIKEKLPHSNDNPGKARMRKTCCAFANSSGGFLIFGISDDRSLTPIERLVGVATKDFPENFGNFPSTCTPSIDWEFKNPPIEIENGKTIHVAHISRSPVGPHAVETATGNWIFPKRTNKGTEAMSFEEIRMAFLQVYEKRLKLQLLRAELVTIMDSAQGLIISEEHVETSYGLGSVSVTVVETILADSYTVLSDHQLLLQALAKIRFFCQIVTTRMALWYPVAKLSFTNKEMQVKEHNTGIASVCKELTETCQVAIQLLDVVIA